MKFIFILTISLLGFSAHSEEITCRRPMYNQSEWSFPNCARKLSTGEWEYKKELLGKLNFGKNNLAPVCIDNDNGCYWVNRDGKMAQVLGIEGSADDFSQGLARHKKNGKIGFIDESLKIVITPKYDFAFPFEGNQTAAVCTGCKDASGPNDDHGKLVGGSWYLINKSGKVLKSCGSIEGPTALPPVNCTKN